jgi:hypothetical protein
VITKWRCLFSNKRAPNRNCFFSNKRAPNRHRLFSDKIAPNYQQLFSDKGTPNGSHNLAMLVTSMLLSSSQNEGICVTYRTPPTEDLLKSQTMALIAMMRG